MAWTLQSLISHLKTLLYPKGALGIFKCGISLFLCLHKIMYLGHIENRYTCKCSCSSASKQAARTPELFCQIGIERTNLHQLKGTTMRLSLWKRPALGHPYFRSAIRSPNGTWGGSQKKGFPFFQVLLFHQQPKAAQRPFSSSTRSAWAMSAGSVIHKDAITFMHHSVTMQW